MPGDFLQANLSQLVCKRLNQNQLPEPIPLSVQAWLLDDATHWPDGIEKVAGSRVFSRSAVYSPKSEPFFDINHTLVNYNGILFEHFKSPKEGKGLITEGGFGCIDVLRNVKTGWLYPIKLSHGTESAFYEVEALEAMDLCKGWAERAVPASTKDFMGYQLQSRIVMPWLGQNLADHINSLSDVGEDLGDVFKETAVYKKRCFNIVIGMAYAVLDLHWAISIVDLDEGVEEGWAHGDIKPDNMLIEEEETPQKIKLVDFGLSNKQLRTRVRDKQGTPPYALFTGQQVPALELDVIALKQSFRTVSYHNKAGKKRTKAGILTPAMIRMHHLYNVFKVDETDLSNKGVAHDALSLTAILIAAEVEVGLDVFTEIGKNPHLAAFIICDYYTYPERTPKERKKRIVVTVFTAETGVENLEVYTVLLKFGLAHDADKALENPELLRILTSDDESFTLKRAAARLFQCGKLNDKNVEFLRENPKLAVEYIRLFYRKDWMALDILLDGAQEIAAFQAFKAPEVPALFSWESEAKIDFLKQQGNKRMFAWLSEKIKQNTLSMNPVERAFQEGVVLRVFLEDEVYREAIYWVKTMLKTDEAELFEGVLSGLLQAHGKRLAPIVLEFKGKHESVWIALSIIANKHFFNLIYLLHQKEGMFSDEQIDKLPSLIRLKKILLIGFKSTEKKQTDTVLLCDYFLSKETLAACFFEVGDEADKRVFLLFCLEVFNQAAISEVQVWQIKAALRCDAFVKAGMVLSQLKLLNVSNLLNIVSDDALREVILSDEIRDAHHDVQAQEIKRALTFVPVRRIAKKMDIVLDGIDEKYVSLSQLIAKINDVFSSQQTKTAMRALLKVYRVLDRLEKDFLSYSELNDALSLEKSLISDLKISALWLEGVEDKPLVSRKIRLVLREIKHFTCKQEVMSAAKEIDKKNQSDIKKGFAFGGGWFSSSHETDTGLRASLNEIEEAVEEVRACLDLIPQSAACLPWFNNARKVQPIVEAPQELFL